MIEDIRGVRDVSRVKFALKDPERKGRVKIKAMQGKELILF